MRGCSGSLCRGVTRDGRDARRRRKGAEPRFSPGGAGVEIEPCRACRCCAGRDLPPSRALPHSALPLLTANVAPKWWVPVPSSVTRVHCWGGGFLTSGGWCKRARGFLFVTLQGAVPLQVAPPTNCFMCWVGSGVATELLYKGASCPPRLGERQSCCSRDVAGHTGTTSHYNPFIPCPARKCRRPCLAPSTSGSPAGTRAPFRAGPSISSW